MAWDMVTADCDTDLPSIFYPFMNGFLFGQVFCDSPTLEKGL